MIDIAFSTNAFGLKPLSLQFASSVYKIILEIILPTLIEIDFYL